MKYWGPITPCARRTAAAVATTFFYAEDVVLRVNVTATATTVGGEALVVFGAGLQPNAPLYWSTNWTWNGSSALQGCLAAGGGPTPQYACNVSAPFGRTPQFVYLVVRPLWTAHRPVSKRVCSLQFAVLKAV